MARHRSTQPKVTIQEVADLAGVSAMTVSNVYNKKGRVGAVKRKRVEAAIKQLGYVPSLAARRLAGSTVSRIGLIYADIESMFLNAAVVAISVAAAQRGIQLLTKCPKQLSAASAGTVSRALVQSGAEALLLIPPCAELLSGWTGLAKLGVPCAAIATAEPLPDMETVRIDNLAAARTITEILLSGGCKRIGIVTGPRSCSDSSMRLEGYRSALIKAGISFENALCVEGGYTFNSGVEAAKTLLDLTNRPDAIVASNDDMAAGVLWEAHRRGLCLPRDLAVTGFDDTLLATRVWPSLTTVRQPIFEIAETALDGLINSIHHPEGAANPRDTILEFSIIERASTLTR